MITKLLNYIKKAYPHFDPHFYLDQYPDVAQAGIDPLEHYTKYGKHEGRFANKEEFEKHNFDPQFYLRFYPDVAQVGIDPWTHYKTYGKTEGRYLNRSYFEKSKFNPAFYLQVYPDVARAGIDPWIHFQKFGKTEGRLGTVNANDIKIIKSSLYFDAGWYTREYQPSLISKNIDPALDYLAYGGLGTRNPGPEFYSNEYLELNPDVRQASCNPLIHYEKYGKFENRPISFASIKQPAFPAGTCDITEKIRERTIHKSGVVSICAHFSLNGHIDNYIIYLLSNLQQISDYIIFVSDCPLFPQEVSKIRSLCDVVICHRHGEYDFGSYKAGYFYAMENNLLLEDDHLIMINDSCYGPVFPLNEVINKYKDSKTDFYGLSTASFITASDPNGKKFLQSFFYIFSSSVFLSVTFQSFFANIKKELSAAHVIYNYEYTLTERLVNAGFDFNSYIDKDWSPNSGPFAGMIPTKYTLTLLKNFRYPMVKIKALVGSTVDPSKEILEFIKEHNITLYNIIKPHLNEKSLAASEKRRKAKSHFSAYTLHDQYLNIIQEIKCKLKTSNKISISFLANSTSMFPGRTLMEKMINDSFFNVELYVIPDMRFGKKEMLAILNDTYSEFKQQYKFTEMPIEVENDEIIQCDDITETSDIICYPSPYDLSLSMYNPYHAIEKNKLSIHINYGFFRSKYDRMLFKLDNYNNFWKVFLENEDNYNEYKAYGQCNGSNAVIAGYSKMDKLAEYTVNQHARKQIIISPHHSILGGSNNVLSLSNFEKYADLFLKLPQEYPQIDFVFRPHPVLFKTLKRKDHWGETKVNEYIEKLTSNENVVYSTSGEYLKVFSESDGIIQDCGSFLAEYLYTGKPCCYMLKSEKDIIDKFSDFGQECLKRCYLAYSEDDILDFIEKVIINEKDILREERMIFTKNNVMINFPHASDTILNYIKNIFI